MLRSILTCLTTNLAISFDDYLILRSRYSGKKNVGFLKEFKETVLFAELLSHRKLFFRSVF